MLSSSSYLPAIDIHKINILIDYLDFDHLTCILSVRRQVPI